MSLAAIYSVIDVIFSLIERVRLIQDLVAGNSNSVITLTDLEAVVSGANAQFFSGIYITDIRTIDRSFRKVWLPTILDETRRRGRITPEELNTGRLSLIYQDLIQAIGNVDTNLNRLRYVFEAYGPRLHVDDLTRGFYAIMHGYTLLFHMHAVFADLHRIQLGAEKLDDPILAQDTRKVLQYLVDGLQTLYALGDAARKRRMALIGPVEKELRQNGPGQWNPALTWYFYRDRYAALPSTSSSTTLDVSNPPAFAQSPARDAERVITDMRLERVRAINWRTQDVIDHVYSRIAGSYTRCRLRMLDRAKMQGLTGAIRRRHISTFPRNNRFRPRHPVAAGRRALIIDEDDTTPADAVESEPRPNALADASDSAFDHIDAFHDFDLIVPSDDEDDFVSRLEALRVEDTGAVVDEDVDPFDLIPTELGDVDAVELEPAIGSEPANEASAGASDKLRSSPRAPVHPMQNHA